MTLTIATLADEDEVLCLLRAFHSESPYKDHPFYEEGVQEAFRKAVQAGKESSVVLLSRNEQNEPTGLLAALKSNVPFLEGSVGLEWAWYVDPQKRTPRTGLLLMEAFEYWCENIAQVRYIQTSSLQTLRPEELDKFYTRRGYTKTETAYIKVL